MAEQNEIVLDIKINTEEVSTKLAAATKALAEHKQQQKELKKAMEESNGTNAIAAKMYAEVSAQIERESREIKSSTALLQAETMARISDNASLDEQRQALNAAQKAYAQLSGEEKKAADSAGGLREQIEKLSSSVKAQEAAIGDTRRNVGNYADSIRQVIPGAGGLMSKLSGVSQTIKSVGTMAQAGAGGFAMYAGAIKAATIATLKFLATPIGLIIGAIALAIAGLVKAFKQLGVAISKNDDASTALARVYAVTLQPIVNGLTAAFGKLAEWVGKAANAFANWVGSTNSASKRADDLVKSVDNLEEAERQYVVNSAQRNAEISRLRDEATNKEKYTLEERKSMLEQARDLEAQNLEDRKNIAAENLRILEETAKRERDTSDATKDKIAEARAEMYRAEQEYHTNVRKMNAQIQSLISQEQREEAEIEKAKTEELRKQVEERKRILAKEAEERERKLAEVREKIRLRDLTDYEREIDALKQARDAELAIDGLSLEERVKIQQQYLEMMAQKEEEYVKKIQEQNAKLSDGLNEDEEEEYIPTIDEMARDMFGLDAEGVEYFRQLLDEGVSIAEAKTRAIADQTQRMTMAFANSFGHLGDAFGQLGSAIGELGNKNKEAMVAMKAFTLTGILLNQAKAISEGAVAIAKGVQSAAGLPFPSNIPAIISITAQIAGMIAGVMSSIVQAKNVFAQANSQKFATGGIVGGNSYTGDKVPIMANSREMVLTTKQQERLFNALDGSNEDGSLGINYEMLAAAMAAQPAPVMVYSELRDFEKNVVTYNEIASI